MKQKGFYILGFLFFVFASAKTQDAQFSQFFVSSSYLNPAFAGETKGGKVALQDRLQWPSIPGAFKSFNFAYDQNLRGINGGLGIIVTHSQAGPAGYQFTNFSALYSQSIRLNQSWYARAGVQIGESIKALNVNQLTFSSQLFNGGNVPDEVQQNYQRKYFLDLSSGVLLYSRKAWFGFSAHHLNRPNESLLNSVSRLPIKYSAHGGFRYTLEKVKKEERDLVFAFNYKNQALFDQLDLGVYYDRKPLVFGLWYRGLPVFKSYQPGYSNNDALIIMLGYSTPGFRIGYSYDITISKLYGSTLGAHELSLVFEFVNYAKNAENGQKRLKNIPCPSF
ncbi:MAG: PorP/SprF family type IX secretion system membrane protein [Bacteroidetes bacterium]|nr:PorP/SprF family type IX secretion system membrane protein [Bacteroidota bacterium]